MKKFISTIIIILLLWGCGMKKESSRQQATEMKRDIRWTDRVKREQEMWGLDNRKIEIRHIEWLPQDSNGLQSVRSVTNISAEEELQVERGMAEIVRTEDEFQEEITMRLEEEHTSKLQDRIIPWGVIGILAILILILYKR